MKIKFSFKNFIKMTRASDWYNLKAVALVLVYIAALYFDKRKSGLSEKYTDFIKWIIFATSFLAFGYMANNLGDIQSDKMAGKINPFIKGSRTKYFIITFGVGAFGIVSVLLINFSSPLTWLMLIICYLIAVIYSLPPRLKENTALGPITSSLAQLILPTLVLLSCIRIFNWAFVLLLSIYFLLGLRLIILHQMFDFKNDIISKVNTFVIKVGEKRARKTIFIIFIIELIVNVAFVSLILKNINNLKIKGIILGLLVLPLMNLLFRIKYNYVISLITYKYVPLLDYYSIFYPLMFCILLISTRGHIFWGFLGIFFFLFFKNIFDTLCSYYFTFLGEQYE